MKIILAPMEGVVDYAMRELLTASGDYDLCVTEFIRVVDQLYRPKHFYKICPELNHGATTRSGTPVRVQLLGQHPGWMAENAVAATDLGSPGIDLNFGCPAKTVNRHRGGAILLREPERLYAIVTAVREAVPRTLTVSAKMRLGYDNSDLMLDCAHAIEDGGATLLTVHARTKAEGYRAPAHWHMIDQIRRHISLPITANGDIWSRADAENCRHISGCADIMLGRGALCLPNLAGTIRRGQPPMAWSHVCELLARYGAFPRDDKARGYLPSRIKQWLRYLIRHYSQALSLFEIIKRQHDLTEIIAIIDHERGEPL